MDMRALLIKENKFTLVANGRVDIDPGVVTTCEKRRSDIKELVSRLTDPRWEPVYDEACRFEFLESFSEKKRIIHAKEAEIQRQQKENKEFANNETLAKAADSEWTLDRIVYYLVQEAKRSPDLSDATTHIRREFEKVRAQEIARPSLMALNYSLAPLLIGAASNAEYSRHAVGELLQSIREFIEEKDLDCGRQVRDKIDAIERHMDPPKGGPSN
jgi:hypothetical protein